MHVSKRGPRNFARKKDKHMFQNGNARFIQAPYLIKKQQYFAAK